MPNAIIDVNINSKIGFSRNMLLRKFLIKKVIIIVSIVKKNCKIIVSVKTLFSLLLIYKIQILKKIFPIISLI